MKTLINVVFFQVLWVVCVGGAGRGYWWPGLVVLAAFLMYHFRTTPYRNADIRLLFAAIAIGALLDSAMIWLGFLRFEQALPSQWLAPIWILALWAGFALTINHSMSFFKDKFWAAVAFGALGGPLAYAVAANVWKAVTFQKPDIYVYVALGIAWGVVTPLLLHFGSNWASKEPGVTS